LGKFTTQEQEIVQQTVDSASNAIADWVAHDTAYCMNLYNEN